MLLCGASLCWPEFCLESSIGSGISRLAQLGHIRDTCNLNGARKGGNEHSENFGKICDWIDEQVENEGFLTLDDFREKYIEITGAISKDWQKLNKRIRTRLNLRSVCTVEQYVGSRNKTRKRHKWRWERKS